MNDFYLFKFHAYTFKKRNKSKIHIKDYLFKDESQILFKRLYRIYAR